MKATFVRFLLLCSILFATNAIFGQAVTDTPMTGKPPFATLKSFGATTLNLANLNSQIAIPLVSKPGRGMPFTYIMTYDNSVWVPTTDKSSGKRSWQPQPNSNFGWHGMSEAITGYLSYAHVNIPCGADTTPRHTVFTGFVYHDPFGVPHSFDTEAVTDTDCHDQHDVPDNTPAADGSGYRLVFRPNTDGAVEIHFVNGIVIRPPQNDPGGSGSVTDVNGNVISDNFVKGEGSFVDTLGTTALTISGAAPSPVSLTYTDSNGAKQSVVLKYDLFALKTNFGCVGTPDHPDQAIAEYTSDTSKPLLTSIGFPDGSAYSFTYESTPGDPFSVTGRIASVTLPTGATINYVYTGSNNGIVCDDGSTAGVNVTTADSGTWHYSRNKITGNQWNTTLIDPAQNQTLYTFSGIYQTQVQAFAGAISGSPIFSATTCYNRSVTTGACATNVLPPIERKEDTTFLDNHLQSATTTFYNGFGLVTAVSETHVANGVGSVARITTIKYASLSNIFNRPSDVTITGDTKVAQTTFAYDPKGNLTEKNQWLNNSADGLKTTYAPNSNGMRQTVTDPGGHTTSFSYDGLCNGAYVTKTTMPKTGSVDHTVSATYDCNTGLVTSSTDQNGQVTTLAYDAMLRPTQANFPDGGQTTITYPDAKHVITKQKLNGSSTTSSEVELDDYGRTSRTITANGEATPFDTQDSCYDIMGRLTFKSYPYQSTGLENSAKVCSGAGDSYKYDPLGRIASVTHSDGSSVQYMYQGLAVEITDEGNATKRILQSDDLGHLAKVCEVSNSQLAGGGNPVSCGADIAAISGFVTSYSYDTLDHLTSVTQGSLAPRTYTYDSLGRMTSETEPEWGSKTTYTYDKDGLLVVRERPAPNQGSTGVTVQTNYIYDALHRLVQTSYTGDNSTTPRDYIYDQTPPGGPALHNPIGRMTFATANNSTAETNDFDVMGRVVTSWQTTPTHSVFALTYEYDPAGNVTSFNNGAGTKFTYSYNGAGRLNGMASTFQDPTHPPTLLSNVHYGPFGAISDVLGNGLAETVTYNARGLLQGYSVSGPSPNNTPPLGFLDSAVNKTNGSTTLPQGGTLSVVGWAGDNEDGSPVAKVVIDLDGVPLGNASEGDSRPDVVNTTGRSDYLLSGFHFVGSIGKPSLGTHTVHATATDSSGSPTVLQGSKTITVVDAPPAYEGAHDDKAVDAATNVIAGWVWDQNHPDATISVDIYDSPSDQIPPGTPPLLRNVPANRSRGDLIGVKGNGLHAFEAPIPESILDGQTHRIHVVVAGTMIHLTGSPHNINPGCVFHLSTTDITVPAQGGVVSIGLTTAASCAWHVSPKVNFAILLTEPNGGGSTTLQYAVPPNPLSTALHTTISVSEPGAVQGSTQTVAITLNGGYQSTLPNAAYTISNTSPDWKMVAVADLTGNGQFTAPDGHPDFIFENFSTGQIAVWPMVGNDVQTANMRWANTIVNTTNSPDWRVVGAGDFNRDGHQDLLLQNSRTGQLSVWYMDTTTVLSTAPISAAVSSTDWKAVAVADFNHDGNVDILFQNQTTRQMVIWLLQGTTVLRQDCLLPASSPNWYVQTVGDMNGDGSVDLILRNTSTGQNAIWYMNGLSVLSTENFLPTVSDLNWTITGTGDVNSDGQKDIVWHNSSTLNNAIWYMSGLHADPNLTGGFPRIGYSVANGPSDGRTTFRALEGSLNGTNWVMEGQNLLSAVLTRTRVGIVDSSGPWWGNLYVKEPGLNDGWQLQAGNVTQVAMAGSRIAILQPNSVVQVKEGSLSSPWVPQTESGGCVSQLFLSAVRVGVLYCGGTLVVKEGGLDAPWVTVASNVDFKVALAHVSSTNQERIGYVDGYGNFYANQGGINAPFVLEAQNVAKIFMSEDRIVVWTNDGTLLGKQGDLNAAWTTVTGPADMGEGNWFLQQIALSGNRLALMYVTPWTQAPNGMVWVQEGGFDQPWVNVIYGATSFVLSDPAPPAPTASAAKVLVPVQPAQNAAAQPQAQTPEQVVASSDAPDSLDMAPATVQVLAPAAQPGPIASGLPIPPPAPPVDRTSIPPASVGANDPSAIYGFSLTYAGNGNIARAQDSLNGDWTYSYDEFNRLLTATTADGKHGENFVYDAYGNRWQENVTQGTGRTTTFTFDNSNRITTSGVIYDALGNVTNDGFHKYVYDAENRLIEVDDGGNVTAKYIYDALGRRVSRTVGTVTTEYLFDLAGRVVAERNTATNTWTRGEVYVGSRHLATYTPFTTYFRHSDWLGSSRVRTLPNGEVAERCTNLPFGDGLNCTETGAQFPTQNPFADYERDQETQLDHTWFRKYSSAEGRWTTADPYLGSMDLTDPQSLNRYAYVVNNPTNFLDPLGLNLEYQGCLITGGDGKQTLDPNIKEKDCNGPGKAGAYGPYSGTTTGGGIRDGVVITDPFLINQFLGSLRGPNIGVPGTVIGPTQKRPQESPLVACMMPPLAAEEAGVTAIAGKVAVFTLGGELGKEMATEEGPTGWTLVGALATLLAEFETWPYLVIGTVTGHEWEVGRTGGIKEWKPEGRAWTRPTMMGERIAASIERSQPGCAKILDGCRGPTACGHKW